MRNLGTRLFIVMLIVGVAAVGAAVVFANLGARNQVQAYLREAELGELYRVAVLFELQSGQLSGGEPLAAVESSLVADDLAALHGVEIELLSAEATATLSAALPAGRDVVQVSDRDGTPALLYALPGSDGLEGERVVLVRDGTQEGEPWRRMATEELPAVVQSVSVVRQQETAAGQTTTTEQRAVVQSPAQAGAGEQLLLQAINRTFAAALAVALLLAGLLSFVLARQLVRPITALTDAARAMGQGQLQRRVAVRGSDELGELGTAFNAMARRLESTVGVLQRFASDAAHELQTPLTALRTNLELAASEGQADKKAAFLDETLAQVKRLEQLSRNLLDLSALESGQLGKGREEISLSRLTADVSERYASRAEQAALLFELSLQADDVRVVADATALELAIGNLLDNALKFTPAGGTIGVRLEAREGMAHLTVSDTGTGITADDAPYVFDRFYRGRQTGTVAGSGLGLSIVQATAEQHGGSVEMERSTPGARFTLCLPLAGEGEGGV